MSKPILALLSALVGAAICAGLALAVISLPARLEVSSAGWPEPQRTSFIDSCTENCRKAPGVTPVRYPLCDQACRCAATEGEKFIPGRELEALYIAHQKGTTTAEQKEKLQRLTDAGRACIAQLVK